MIEHLTLSRRAELRDARTSAARERLYAAPDEAMRAEAVLEELRAKLDFEREIAAHGLGPTATIAARVMVGQLTVDEAVLIEQANGDLTTSGLASELSHVASAEHWERFEACAAVNVADHVTVIQRLCDAGDRVGALRVLALGDLVSTGVAAVARVFGRDEVRGFRDAALESIALAEAQRGEDPWYFCAQIAQLSYALSLEEQRALVVAIADERSRSNLDDGQGWRISRAAATIALALFDVGERGAAARWIEELVLTERFEPAWVCFEYAQMPVIAAVRARSTPEEFAAWEQKLRAFYRGKEGVFALLHAHVSEAWRDELVGIIRARTDATASYIASFSALSREQQRTYVRHALRRGTTTPSRTAFARRLEDDAAFEEALLAWTPRRSHAWRRLGESYEPLGTLLDAAADNNVAAIDALCHWSDPDEVLSVPQFSLGLSREVILRLLARATHAPRLDHEFVAWSHTFLANASPEARERWRRERSFDTRDPRDDEADRERRWRSLANAEDAASLASVVSWRDRGAEDSYRALIRCVALRCADRAEDERLRAVQRALLERVVDYNFEYWEGAMIAAITESFDPTIGLERARFEAAAERVLQARPEATYYATDAMLSDCCQLGIADLVIEIVAENSWVRARAECLCALIPLASDASRVAAIDVLRATFRTSAELPALPAAMPYLTSNDVLSRWPSIAGSTSVSLLDAPLLTKVGGAALVDRAGDMVVALLQDAASGMLVSPDR